MPVFTQKYKYKTTTASRLTGLFVFDDACLCINTATASKNITIQHKTDIC